MKLIFVVFRLINLNSPVHFVEILQHVGSELPGHYTDIDTFNSIY